MFSEKKTGTAIYLVSDKLNVPHGFTTRYGGVSEGIWSSLNVGENRGDRPEHVRENYARVGAIIGVGPDDFVTTRQVHENTVHVAAQEDRRKVFDPVPYDADGLVTNIRDLPLMIYIADCIPMLLSDEVHGVVGAVHCGWKSSVADILGNAIREMISLGADPTAMTAAIGPGIGVDHFEVGPEVVEAARNYLGEDLGELCREKDNGKFMLDLKRVNARRLVQLGVPAENIDISEECTMCHPEKYWSHRVTKGERGSQCAIIKLL